MTSSMIPAQRVRQLTSSPCSDLVSLHLHQTHFEVYTPKSFCTTRELCFPSLRNLTLAGELSFDEIHTRRLMSLSPLNCPRLDAICAPKVLYHRWHRMEQVEWDNLQIKIRIIRLACEAFQHQLRALLVYSAIMGGTVTYDCLASSLHLLILQGPIPGYSTPVGLVLAEFCAGRKHLSRPTYPSPNPRIPVWEHPLEEVETLYIGKRPLKGGITKSPTEPFDLQVAKKWMDIDGEATSVTWRDDIAEMTRWNKGWNPGFWKVVAELRVSPEWDV